MYKVSATVIIETLLKVGLQDQIKKNKTKKKAELFILHNVNNYAFVNKCLFV